MCSLTISLHFIMISESSFDSPYTSLHKRWCSVWSMLDLWRAVEQDMARCFPLAFPAINPIVGLTWDAWLPMGSNARLLLLSPTSDLLTPTGNPFPTAWFPAWWQPETLWLLSHDSTERMGSWNDGIRTPRLRTRTQETLAWKHIF